MRYILINIVIILAFIVFASCGKQISKDIVSNKENSVEVSYDTTSNLCDKCVKKHEVNNPDYVPPCDGGINGKWCNNRHRMLTNDSNCYFKRSNRKK